MKQRCSAPPGHKDHEAYAGRGIRVCERWQDDFAAFYADMGPRPGKGYSIDVNGHYETGNCRWATAQVQATNKRDSVWLEHQGENLPLVTWAERTGLDRKTIQWRLDQGWPVEQALTAPAFDSFKVHEFRGEKDTLTGWAARFGYTRQTITRYLNEGMTLEAILTMFGERREERRLELDGVKKTPEEWAAEYGLTARTIHVRLHRLGWSVRDAITRPLQGSHEFRGEKDTVMTPRSKERGFSGQQAP